MHYQISKLIELRAIARIQCYEVISDVYDGLRQRNFTFTLSLDNQLQH
ncbi:MAG: hypothetical protein RMX68_005645 [Aulosira sp. ZfuVER01]|nr:hypothetical protein [Aulosira sp. DedVER01a]